MSIKVMTRVWEGYPGGGTELLALLALADWSDDDGRCFPSMASIGAKVRLSRSQAQRVIHRLIEAGYVAVTGNEAGGAPGSSRQYRINLSMLTGRMDATGRANATGRMDAVDGSHGCGETGRMGAARTVSEPSVNRQRVARQRATRLPDDWALPEDWKTEALELRPTWTPDFVNEVAASFRDYWVAKAGQSAAKLDWLATWRNWVRKEDREPAQAAGVIAKNGRRWWTSDKGIEEMAHEYGLSARPGESYADLKNRIFAFIGQQVPQEANVPRLAL